MAYPFKLPDLGYPYDALEPHIDAQTMEIHHTKHHQAYVNNANQALEKHSAFHQMEAEEIMARLPDLPEEIRTAVRNNAGGHLNHGLFWRWMKPGGAREPKGKLLDDMGAAFGSFDGFKDQFGKAAIGRFGSGWAWLVVDSGGALKIVSTPNQDSPVMDGLTPVLGIDVWEHAYYLKYQNRRADYVNAWWNVVNWDAVGETYGAAKKK
jgi:Fe-Mn family superoxide dismutase